MDEGRRDGDIIFFETLYRINPELRRILWKGYVYDGLDDFATRLLTATRQNSSAMDAPVGDMLTNGVLSAYIQLIQPEAAEQIRIMRAFESAHRTFSTDGVEKTRVGYQLGFMLAAKKDLVVDGHAVSSLEELVSLMKQLAGQRQEAFEDFCGKLIHEDNTLDLQFECWLMALGKGTAIEEWRRELQA